MLSLRLVAPEALSGRIIGDIINMRGEFDSPVISSGKVSFDAIVPASSSIDYPAQFMSQTSGKGRISIKFHSYRPCPKELGATAKRREVNPLDRAKWILYKRGALK
jgi:ribosomal protection tetracycline resistance protein